MTADTSSRPDRWTGEASGRFSPDDRLTGETVELLQQMIRNRCVNDGTPESGEEWRNAELLTDFLGGTGLDIERYDAGPGRTSIVARIEGTDPTAPRLCLMGHTDVVPVNPDGWKRDPFGGELVATADGRAEVWGRGAVDMLNLTASMAVAFREIARSGRRPAGDLIYFAVADEESGSAYGMRHMADHHPEAIRADYVLTENGGLHSGPAESPRVGMNVAEKGVAWRRLRVRGTPGHGSTPLRADNALMTAAAVMHRLGEYRPAPRFHELWHQQVATMGLDDESRRALLDPRAIDAYLDVLPNAGMAAHLHACTHTTFSCNTLATGNAAPFKTNVIPDCVDLGVDVRTLPGEDGDDVAAHLRAALGDLVDRVEVHTVLNDPASISRTDTPLWSALERAVNRPFPAARVVPQLIVGFTDARIYREMGAVAYGAGLFSPDLDPGEYGSRFHGHNERIDVESLRLTTQLWLDVVDQLWA